MLLATRSEIEDQVIEALRTNRDDWDDDRDGLTSREVRLMVGLPSSYGQKVHNTLLSMKRRNMVFKDETRRWHFIEAARV